MTRPTLGLLVLATLAAAGCALFRFADEPEAVIRGRYLVEVVAACGNCHTASLGGGFEIAEDFGVAISSNIGAERRTGIGAWPDADIIRAIRMGRGRDGRILGPPMPYHWYASLTDTDLHAIVAYLRTVAPIEQRVAKSRYTIRLPSSWGPRPPSSIPDVPTDDPVRYGSYLTGAVAHCLDCHTPRTADGRVDHTRLGAGGRAFHGPWGVSYSANLTSDREPGLGAWTDSEIVASILGARRGGGRVLPPMPVRSYLNGIRESDLQAILAYLRSLPPRTNVVPAPEPPR